MKAITGNAVGNSYNRKALCHKYFADVDQAGLSVRNKKISLLYLVIYTHCSLRIIDLFTRPTCLHCISLGKQIPEAMT